MIENWNSANAFILYGKGGEFASNKLENQELLMLSSPIASPGRIPIDAAGELLMEETKPCTIGGADPAEPHH